MARQNRTKQAEASAEATDNQEAQVTESTDTTTEATPESTDEATAEPTPVDLTAFKQSVEVALAEADTSTGELPEEQVALVNKEYRALDGQKPKNEARKFLEEGMLAAVGELDAVKARSYSDLKVKLTATGGPKKEPTPTDPVAAYVQRMASLRLAEQVVNAQAPEFPEGREVSAEVAALVSENEALVGKQLAHLADESEDKGEGPELTPVVRAAFKAASGKASGGTHTPFTGTRRDIGAHITSAFADKEVGTYLSISEIAKHRSAEYGDEAPSQGAISARLFPTTTVEGVEPIEKGAIDGKNPKGARKVEVASS